MEPQRTPRTTPGRPWNMSLCWFCENAVPCPDTGAGCSWTSQAHTPVEGWKAERRDLNMGYKSGDRRTEESYRVLACPDFKEG